MAKQKLINLWLLIPLILSFLVSLVFFIWNKVAEYPTNKITISILLFAIPIFLIFLSWNGLRMIKNKVGLWICAFAFPFAVFGINLVLIQISNWGTLGGGESYLSIALNSFIFGIIAGIISLIGNLVISIKGSLR